MPPRGTGTRLKRLTAALAVAVGLCTSWARAEEPRVTCTATRAGRRVLVRPEVSTLVAPELERLMRLGLAGRLELELELLRLRPLWFAEQVEGTRLTQVLVYVKEEGWVMDGRSLSEGLGVLELERVAWMLESEPEADTAFRVEVRVRLQVVTADSLGRVAAWLTQGKRTEQERSALTQGLLRTVAEDLTRRAQGRCDVQPAK